MEEWKKQNGEFMARDYGLPAATGSRSKSVSRGSDSFLATHTGRAARNEFRPVPISLLGPSQPVDWLTKGLVGGGYMTLLAAFAKTGKTTFLTHLLRDWERGGPLAEQQLEKPVLVVSEESSGHWMRRRDSLALGDGTHLELIPFMGRPNLSEWEQLIADIESQIKGGAEYAAVVFDTLASLWPVTEENDAGAVSSAIMPLRRLTEAGAAVILVHHTRKGDASEGRASRGSGALPAMVDIIVELRRFAAHNARDTRRVLTSFGRFDESEPELVIDLQDEGYVIVGDRARATEEDRITAIRELLNSHGQLTVDRIYDMWPNDLKPSRRTLAYDLNVGAERDLWTRLGTGKRGDPFHFARIEHPA